MNTIFVNNISFDQEHSILCAATTKGYRIYENNSYLLLNEFDDYQDLKLARTLYKSNLIAFVGSEDNLSFPSNQLIIWDDYKHSKIGMVLLKEKILNFKLSKNALFIMIQNKILLFDLISLTYVCSFNDADEGVARTSLSLLTNPMVLAYSSCDSKYVIKINKILIGEKDKEKIKDKDKEKDKYKGRIKSKFQMMIITTFNEIQYLEVSPKSEYLMAFSKFGNKIHIYSLEDFQLKFCLFLTNQELKIMDSCFNNKSKFVAILTYNRSGLNLNLFDLKNSDTEDHLCQCDDHNDSEVNHISSLNDVHKTYSFFGSFVSKLKTSIYSDEVKSFAYLKIKPSNYISSLLSIYTTVSESNFFSPFILNFHHFHKDELVCYY